MVVIEWVGLMAVTGLIIFFMAGLWVLKEQGDFIITSKDWQDWLIGVIVAITFIFSAIWVIFIAFYNEPESFGYEKIIVEEAVDAGNEP